MFSTLTTTLVRQVVFPLWARRNHPDFARYRTEFERTQYLSRREIEARQLESLRRLLEHAYRNCAYYRRRMDDAGLRPEQVRQLNDLQRLPVLTKKDIQQQRDGLVAQGFPEQRKVRNQTGGSTGSPLQFYVDVERLDSRMASTVRHDAWAKLRPGDWCAYLWGARLDQVVGGGGWWNWCRKHLLYRRIELNTSLIRESDWEGFVGEIQQRQPRKMIAYAQSAVLFARYVRERGIKGIEFDSIITTAEVLMPEQRELLEETFHAKVFNRYGCREVSVIASECEYHTGLHVNAEALLVEVVPHPELPAPTGRIVVTDLLNLSMPLIRYEIGDVGRWAEEQDCPCGRKLPLLTGLEGRTTDFIVLADGRRISGPSLTLVVADMPDVSQVQFVQRSLTQIGLRVVPGKGYGEPTRQELRKRLGLYLGDQAQMQIEEVASINSEASGKYRFVVNEMPDAPGRQGAAARERV